MPLFLGVSSPLEDEPLELGFISPYLDPSKGLLRALEGLITRPSWSGNDTKKARSEKTEEESESNTNV